MVLTLTGDQDSGAERSAAPTMIMYHYNSLHLFVEIESAWASIS